MYAHKIDLTPDSDNWKVEQLLINEIPGDFPKILTMELLDKHRLGFNNGRRGWFRPEDKFHQKYKAEVYARGQHRKILSIIVYGYQSVLTLPPRASIPATVKKDLVGKICPILGITATEIDHKDGHDGSVDGGFQALCKAANDTKRQHCYNCKCSGRRFDARPLGFPEGWTEGGADYTAEQGCVGCYQFDPFKFTETMIRGYKKSD